MTMNAVKMDCYLKLEPRGNANENNILISERSYLPASPIVSAYI